MKCALTILVLSLLVAPGLAQVDSLVIREISSINCPEGISQISFADIYNNGGTEIIVQGPSHIYIYDAVDTALLWTSPYSWYNDIKFFDMNHDGDLDIAYRDTSGFYIYDIIDSTMILSDRHLKDYLYNLGDRNSDGIEDIVAMRRQPFEPSNLPDTVYVEIYDGPNYQLAGQFDFTVTGYRQSEPTYGWLKWSENPAKIIIADIAGSAGIERKIVIFTSIDMDHYQCLVPGYECQSYSTNGNIKLIDPINFDMININNCGALSPLSGSTQYIDHDSSYLYAITQNSATSVDLGGDVCWDSWETNKFSLALSADGLINSTRIYHYYINTAYSLDWRGFLMGDIDPANNGNEICFGDTGSLQLLSFPDLTPLWTRAVNLGEHDYLTAIYHSNILFRNPQILVQSRYNSSYENLFDGSTGELSGVIIGNVPTFMAKDINNDGEDELVTAWGNPIHIYHLELAPTAINNDYSALPNSFRLYANYPNPFNPATTIEYDLPKSAIVSLDIFDILGRKIETLINTKQEAGRHKAVWDGKDRTSGIYFYRIKAGDFTETRKMLLLR